MASTDNPKVGDKIRLTTPDETSLACGYKPGDEAVIVEIEKGGTTNPFGLTSYGVKWTKGVGCEFLTVAPDYDEILFADEFEVLRDDV